VIDTYDTSCELPDDACTRFAAHVWIDPPPILEDGPIVFGEASTTERHVKDQKTCDGCGCSGGGGLEPGSL
jgi:hypothetical protein